MSVLIALTNQGKAKITITALANQLKHLQTYANLNDPEIVKAFIANKTTSEVYKQKLCQAYNYYAKHYKIEWTMPNYKREEKMPKLPTEEQLNKLINASGKILSLKLWLSKETGLRPVEVHSLQVKNIDTEHNTINPTTAKHGSGRILPITPNLTKALLQHTIRNNLEQNDKVFRGNPRQYGNAFREMRDRIAKRTNDPSLTTVRLYDFRHWFATMRYWKYRDVGLTAMDMGHRDWNTTQKYVHLLRIIELQTTDEWICKTANNIEEAKELIEHGFEYIQEKDGTSLYRKRK